ncbi:MAG TPA: hypothetical protein VKE95_16420 [Burkholderiales bacterium]|nr:hypothetical protein [Burkholderiales bacterium]
MKRLILAASIALSTSAFADNGKPFEQTEADRALPQIEFAAVAPYHAGSSAPHEDLVIDRMLPNLPAKPTQYAQADGGTRVDAASEATESPWAKDPYFIAPPL